MHHPLESTAVMDGAVAVPGGDTSRQDALNGASVEVCEGLRSQDEFLQPPEVLHSVVCVDGPFQVVSDVMCMLVILTISTEGEWEHAPSAASLCP